MRSQTSPTTSAVRPAGSPFLRRSAARILALAMPAALGAGLLFPASVHAAVPTCFGQPATIVGTNGNDNLSGTTGNDVIVGLGGDDTIHGNGGTDLICGGPGNDLLHADGGSARMSGGSGDDRLFGGPLHDVLKGDDGNDQLFGAAGADNIDGGTGDDLIDGGAGNDRLNGGAGFDVVSYQASPAGVQVSLSAGTATGNGSDTLAGFEGVFGSSFDDVLTGDAGPTNLLVGGPGSDVLNGGDGPSTNCTASGSCFDYMAGGDGNDALNGGPGNDFAAFFDSLFPVNVNLATGVATGEGNDTLTGIEGIDGSNGSDTLTGDANDNFFIGEAGNDQIAGGGHVSGDAAFYIFALGPVAASLASGTSSGADGADTLSNIQSLAGSDFNDRLIGNAQANTILGEAGNDYLDGRAGTDSLDGGTGTDRCLNGETVTNCEATTTASVAPVTQSIQTAGVAAQLAAIKRWQALSGFVGSDGSAGGGIKMAGAGGVAGEPRPRPSNHALAPLATYVASPLNYCGGSYRCGPTMLRTTLHTIYWFPTGYYVSPNYAHLTSQFLSDVGGTGLYQIATQYYWTWYGNAYHVQNQAAYGGYYFDTTPFPQTCNHPYTGTNCVLEQDLQQAVHRAMVAKGWSASDNDVFFVFTPYNEGSCDSADCHTGSGLTGASYRDYCGYHSSFSGTNPDGSAAAVIWSYMPFSQDPYDYFTAKQVNCDRLPGSTGPNTGNSPNNDVAADSEINTLSHELIEAITDPYGAWKDSASNSYSYTGWYDAKDNASGGGEIGDKCSLGELGDLAWGPESFDNGLADMYASNHVGGWDYYNVQREFSNAAFYASGSTAPGAGCVISG